MIDYGIPEPEQEPKRFYTIPIPKDQYRILAIGDAHIPTHNKRTIELAFSYGLEKQVDCILMGGDMLDWYSLSTFEKMSRNLQFELDMTYEFLRATRKVFPAQKIIWMDGNHDFRLERFKMRNEGRALAGLEVLQSKNLLQLKDFDIDYYDNYATLKIGKLYVMHGHKLAGAGKMVARNKLMNAMNNLLFFHHHTVQDFFIKDLSGSVIGAHAIGCCCQLQPDYSIHNAWMNGFAGIEVNADGSFTVDNKKIINGEVR